MSLNASFTEANKRTVSVTLNPGDELAGERVIKAYTIPAYTEPGYTQPAYTVGEGDDAVEVPEHEVAPVEHPAVEVPDGAPKTLFVSVSDDNPVWVALKALVDAGEVTIAEPPAAVVVIAKVDLFRKLTDDEYTALLQGVGTQSARIQGIFNAAQTFRSDAEEWGLLNLMANKLYTPERAKQLLDPEYYTS